MSWVFIKAHGESLYTVGFYEPDGQWHSESDYDTNAEAAARVHYLNGGTDGALADIHGALTVIAESVLNR